MKNKKWIIGVVLLFILVFILIGKGDNKIILKEKDYSSSYSKLAINILKNKANDKSITNTEEGNVYEMYAFNHENTYYLDDNTDYRYTYYNPDNYIYFNCSDMSNKETCELWRIVGVFPVKDNNNSSLVERVKIVREDSIGQYAYDENGTTDWGKATLKDYLNNEYYNSLSDSAKEMISSTLYYLSPIGNIDTVEQSDYYNKERRYYVGNYGTEYYRYSSTWTGNVALLYPSDYYYGSKWIGQLGNTSLLNREEFPSWGNNNLIITSNEIIDHSSPTTLNEIRPTVYLNSDVLITSGHGTITSPYFVTTKDEYLNQKFEYKVGDEIYYNNELYYILDNSLSTDDYVVAFKDVPLKEKYTKSNILDTIGELPFDKNDKCYYNSKVSYDYSGCTNNLNSSSIKKFLDKWSENEFNNDDLVSVDGYKVRLITEDELSSVFKFVEQSVQYGTSYRNFFGVTDETPDFIKNRNYSCWTMDNYQDSNRIITFSKYLSDSNTYNLSCVDPVINFKKSSVGNISEYSIGDEIIYNGANYYVISDSSSNIDYVTVLKKNPLTIMEMIKYDNTVDTSNSIGKVIYMDSNSNIPIVYENSNVRNIVDSWIDKNFDDDDLKEINGLRGRLISYDELLENLYYDYSSNQINSVINRELIKTSKTPEWAYKYKYWTETPKDDNGKFIFVVTNYGNVIALNIESFNAVRPVVYLKKSAIGKISSKYVEDDEDVVINDNKKEVKCTPKYRKETINYYNEYKVGDEITYNNDKYYVIGNSDKDRNYVTVLKSELLSSKDFNPNEEYFKKYLTYSFNEKDITVSYNYYDSDLCNNDNQSDCKNTYDTSNVKKIIDNWVKVELDENDLVSVNGYKARILTLEELVNNFGYEKSSNVYSSTYSSTIDIPNWLYAYSYWIDGNFENNNYNYFMSYKNLVTNNVYYPKLIIPIINLKKIVLGDKNEYIIGDEITYKNNKYYVIENSDSSKDYVALFKEKPFTQNQVNLYSKLDFDNDYNEFINGLYLAQYYSSDKCSNARNLIECKNDYDSSNIKSIIDEWINIKNIDKDLIEVDGYKARLLNGEDLFNNLNYTNDLYFDDSGYKDSYVTNVDVPSFIYNIEKKYWTMIDSDKSSYIYDDDGNTHLIYNISAYIIFENGYLATNDVTNQYSDYVYVNDYYAIRPVLNINKCAIDGGCITEEIEIEDGCIEDDTSLVNVPSTLSFISKIVLIISGLLILCGLSIFSYNYYKSRKERK